MTSKLFTVDELVEDKVYDANLSDDGEVIPPSFKGVMYCIEKFRTYFFCQNNGEKTINELYLIHNYVLNPFRDSGHKRGHQLKNVLKKSQSTLKPGKMHEKAVNSTPFRM
ncbi:hypothetical protein AVEN_178506-1 [Araneus ventricosus]|uniref:Uncharacterized protein n=1 Tax=Araneus ventricosus TaxID=182803 RepID=A0A4Y2CFD3_ARAVE|nr:hypothetical protein AVEN_178506-1 [Araneus ventricosus]